MKILFVEDDANLAFMLTDGLESEGFTVAHYSDGITALNAITEFKPNIILLDVNLNGSMNGFETAKKIRLNHQTPVIFTTSRTQIEDIQEGFSIGNVDYLKKPFGIRELVLRINELLSRNSQSTPTVQNYKIGLYTFNPSEQNLQINNDRIRLQKNECAVLILLAANAGNVVNKVQILETVWDEPDYKQKEASLHNIMSSLRTMLNKDQNVGIETIPKVGWKLTIK